MNNITQEGSWEGRRLTLTWHGSSFVPPRSLVTQASGVCFTHEGTVVLVTKDGKTWGLPGGRPENDETIEEAFIREVREEACAMVTKLVYIGAQEVRYPEETRESTYYQTRFWARIQLEDFKSDFETTGRKLVTPETINASLRWKPGNILDVMMKAAIECEYRFRLAAKQMK